MPQFYIYILIRVLNPKLQVEGIRMRMQDFLQVGLIDIKKVRHAQHDS